MGEQLSTGIALCTAWDGGDFESWAAITRDHDATEVMGQLSHIGVQLAKALAGVTDEFGSSVAQILNYLALDALNDDGESLSP